MKKMLVAVALALIPVTVSPPLAESNLSSMDAAAVSIVPQPICIKIFNRVFCF